jgi:hypothetical protein
MWHTSNRKPLKTTMEHKESSANAIGVPTATTNTSNDGIGEDWKSILPLDWTRIGRRTTTVTTKRQKIDDSTGEEYAYGDDENCCQDPAYCLRRRYVRPITTNTTNNNQSTRMMHGKVIFCLHEYNPQWFQGYFVPKMGSKKPWGLLAQQEEIDECLVCSDGGYRRISLTIYTSKINKNNDKLSSLLTTTETKSSQQKNIIQGIDWTGGDMMTLFHPDYIEMIGEKVLTGPKCLPILQKYFHNLIMQLHKDYCDHDYDNDNYQPQTTTTTILEWLPDVTIVVGSMSLSLRNIMNVD